MKIVAIVQARLGSTRLPGKVIKKITGKFLIQLLLQRLSKSAEIDEIVVATTINKADNELQSIVEKLGYRCFRGSENDVLSRYLCAARESAADVVVRITGDCPLVDAGLIDEIIKKYKESDLDYYSNTIPSTFPDGLDTEVFRFNCLEKAHKLAINKYDKEHVTPLMKNTEIFKSSCFKNNSDLSSYRWTVDEDDDLHVITNVFEYFYPEVYFSWMDVLKLQTEQPLLFAENKNIIRDEGATMNKGQKLYKRAKKVIPGGTMLLSKRPEMFLPGYWPAYFSKAKGCKVWDLEDIEYTDMSIMGIGTNTLGYGDPEVDEAVINTVKNGNMSTLNCPEEVFLAEKLIDIHPWADKVRFARSGGEINSIAVRIARAATEKDIVAICGYHGWHDWYLSTNLSSDKNLDGHLLSGLEPRGVPRSLVGSTVPFEYNNLEQLNEIIESNKGKIAAIKMEVSRNFEPQNNFLQEVRKLSDENGIVLIFDECTSGFREEFGGLHKKYNVDPDMAVFAKALGNGYAISACIGRDDVMRAAEKTFISSTFWTERIGPTAALKVLEVMERERSWEKITNQGHGIKKRWEMLAGKYDLKIDTWGLSALAGFTLKSKSSVEYKTLITQEMLKKGFLASNVVYSCTQHTPEIIDEYFEHLDVIFNVIAQCEDGRNIEELLDGPVCHTGFNRLN